MLKFTLMTARNTLAVCFLAVFFSQTAKAVESNLTAVGDDISFLVFDLSRSVVTVETIERIYPGSARFPVDEAVQKRVSTGLIVDSSGHVLVSAKNVVGHDQLAVRFADKVFPAGIVAIDYHTDLALLRTDRAFGRPVSFSQSQICAGQMVINLAYSQGMRASPRLGFCAGSRPDGNLQFALPVTPESIGGGVFDLDGRLLGIVIAGLGDQNQIAQAVPAYRLRGIIDHLKTIGDRPAGFIGVSSIEIEIYPPLDLPPMARVDSAVDRVLECGVIVTDVMPKSAAEMAGLKVGDLIFSYDNRIVTSATDLANWVKRTRPGTMVIVDILRQTTHYQVQMRIGNKELIPQPVNALLTSRRDSKTRLIDSLKQELNYLKNSINLIERKLGRISQ